MFIGIPNSGRCNRSSGGVGPAEELEMLAPPGTPTGCAGKVLEAVAFTAMGIRRLYPKNL